MEGAGDEGEMLAGTRPSTANVDGWDRCFLEAPLYNHWTGMEWSALVIGLFVSCSCFGRWRPEECATHPPSFCVNSRKH